MSVTFFQIALSVQRLTGGKAVLTPPQVVEGIDYDFILVKEGGAEGIIQVDAPEAKLKEVASNENCKRLTAKQAETLQKSYPLPKLKQKYRAGAPLDVTGTVDESFAVDEQGKRVVDTLQTVRSGFYLIDVPIITRSTGA